MKNIQDEENPCDTCLINTMCFKMCEKAKPYYQGLVVEDKNFNVDEYFRRRDRIYSTLAKQAQDKEDVDKARELTGISKSDHTDYFFDGKPLQLDKLIEKEEKGDQLTLSRKLLKSQAVVFIRKKFRELFQGVY